MREVHRIIINIGEFMATQSEKIGKCLATYSYSVLHKIKRVTVVVLCIYYQASCYIYIHTMFASLKFGVIRFLMGVPNSCIVWISPKTLCSPVLALLNFADLSLLTFPR